jgi:hypothetical protein
MKVSYVLFCCFILVVGGTNAVAGTIVEFFNGYGGRGDLNTKGAAGNGWLSGWTGSKLPKFQDGQLQYFAPWFEQQGNGSDPDTDGSVNSGAVNAYHLPNPDGIDPNSVVWRSFDPFTGTVWISAVTLLSDAFPIIGPGEGTILWLEPNSNGIGGPNYVGIRSDVGATSAVPEPLIQYGGAIDSSNNTLISRGPSKLMLARIEIDVGGTPNDTLTYWVNPNFNGDVAHLNGQALYSTGGSDVFGPSFDSIGISFGAGLNVIDSIRVSSSLEGVGFVGPEPTTFVSLVMAIWFACAGRTGRTLGIDEG